MGLFGQIAQLLLDSPELPGRTAVEAGLFFDRAAELPLRWDEIAADNFYLRRQMLETIERTLSARQRYHLFGAPVADSALVTFRWRVHVTGRLCWPATVFGVPGGGSRCGFALGPRGTAPALAFLRQVPGLKLVLSSPDDLAANTCRLAPTSHQPSYLLDIRWRSFGAYVDAMRSDYRRRVRRALDRCSDLTVDRRPPGALNDDLYPLYLQVYQRARQRLMPLDARLLFAPPGEALVVVSSAAAGGRPIAFAQLFRNDGELLFYKGGLDYRALGGATADLYLFLLLKLIELAIDEGFAVIDMGKSAGQAKMRLGCRRREQRTFAGHSNPLLHRALGAALRLRRGEVGEASAAVFRVFKDETQK